MNEFKNELQNLSIDGFQASGMTPNAGQGQLNAADPRLCIGFCIGFCVGCFRCFNCFNCFNCFHCSNCFRCHNCFRCGSCARCR